MADSVLVVVSILEGRGFPHLQHQLLLLEGKFNGECLETDPVPHTTAPKVNTELAWELSRKSLHQHKLQRTPLKLQCSCVDERTKKKDPMGYIMLDLRQAHSAVASSNSARWYGISNSQYHGKKPELRIVITMETESHYEPIPPRPISSLSQSSTGSSHLSMVLDEEEGYYVLGERDKCGRIFIVSVMIAHHRNLSQVVSLTTQPKATPTYHFYYCLFGNDIHSEPLSSLQPEDFEPERASVRFLTYNSAIVTFLASQPELKIHFCCDGDVMATVSIPLSQLSHRLEYSGDFPFVLPSSSVSSAMLGVVVSVVEEPLANTQQPGCPSSSAQGPVSSVPLLQHPQGGGGEGEESSLLMSGSAKRNLKKSFDEAAKTSTISTPSEDDVLSQDSHMTGSLQSGEVDQSRTPASTGSPTPQEPMMSLGDLPVLPELNLIHHPDNMRLSSGAPPTNTHQHPVTIAPPTNTHQHPVTIAPPTDTHQHPVTIASPTSTHQYRVTTAPPTSTHQHPVTIAPPTSTHQHPVTTAPPTSTRQHPVTTAPPTSTCQHPVTTAPLTLNYLPSSMAPISTHPPSSHDPPTLTHPPSSHDPPTLTHPPLFHDPSTLTHPLTDQSVHHFSFSIDVKSVKNLSKHHLNCWLRYRYPFFGVGSYVLFQPPLLLAPTATGSFAESYCVFEFATSMSALMKQLQRFPLVIQVFNNSDLTGLANVPLSGLLSEPKTTVRQPSGATGLRQTTALQVTVKGLTLTDVIGEITLNLSMEDFGPTQLNELQVAQNVGVASGAGVPPGVGGARESSTAATSSLDKTDNPRTSSQYKTALELELWKEEREKAFLLELKEKEASHLKLLASEQQRREEERETQFRRKIEEYTKLEVELKSAIRDVRHQQDTLRERELQLEKSIREVTFEREQLGLQVSKESQHVRDSYGVQLELEKSRVSELDQQVKRLMGQLTDSDKRYKALEAEFMSYRESVRTQPESQLQAQVSMLQLEKSELERKLSSVSRSKVHYKQQWSKALHEVALMRQREQKALRDKLAQQEREVNELKKSIQVSADTKELGRELAEIKEATMKLTERAAGQSDNVTQERAAGQSDRVTLDHHGGGAIANNTVAMDTDVSRLIEERDTLLQTGVYTTEDPTIVCLDDQIRNAMKRGT